jgi:lysozyme family protein
MKENFENWVKFLKFWKDYEGEEYESLKKLYWERFKCDLLPSKLDIIVADMWFYSNDEETTKKILDEVVKESKIIFGEDLAEKYAWIIAILKRSDYLDELSQYETKGRKWNKRLISLYDYLKSDFKILSID